MACSQAKSDVRKITRQPSIPKSQGKRPQGIQEQPQRYSRRSPRLQELQFKDKDIKPKHLFSSPITSNTLSNKVPQSSPALLKAIDSSKRLYRPSTYPGYNEIEQLCSPGKPRQLDRKRNRSQEAEFPLLQDEPAEKRARTSLETCVNGGKEAASNTTNKKGHPIDHWLQEGSWPKEYFKPGSQTWEDLGADREADKLAEELQRQEEWDKKQAVKVNNMAHPLLARKRSSASIRRQYEELGIQPPSDLPREEKSAKYTNLAYEIELESNGSFMRKSDLDITNDNKALCKTLLSSVQTVIQDSLFRDDRFETACKKIHNENEARVLQDITRLIVPSAETLATCGATGLEHLVESVDRGWNSAIPITTPRPQPDYSVAFGQSAFTNDQLEKLKPFVGDLLHQPTDFSYFMATWRMYFPFLTCEVKCGAAALDIADRQNAHSMTHAVRAVVELYKYAKWEEGFDWTKEVHREILAFSISHDDRAVRIYGHYPVIEHDRTTFYRHPIRDFSLTDLDGREKWTAYKFTKNVYELWMPKHLKRIRKAIDALPVGLDFRVSSAPLPSLASAENDLELADSQEMATSAPASQDQDAAKFKKPRLTANSILQRENDRLRQETDRQREEMQQQRDQGDQLRQKVQDLIDLLAQEKQERKSKSS